MNHTILICIFSITSHFLILENANSQDTVQSNRSLYIALDFAKPAMYFVNSHIFQYEAGFGLKTVKNFNMAGDFGFARSYFELNNYNVGNHGFYAKIGANKLILNDGDDWFSFGFRLAGSGLNQKYSDVVIYDTIYSKQYDVHIDPYSSIALWGEALIKLDIHIKGNVSFGWMMRFKFPFYMPASDYFKPYYVPGYGKTNGAAMIGFNYYIYYNFPLKNKQ